MKFRTSIVDEPTLVEELTQESGRLFPKLATAVAEFVGVLVSQQRSASEIANLVEGYVIVLTGTMRESTRVLRNDPELARLLGVSVRR